MSKKKKNQKVDNLEQLEDEMLVDTLFQSISKDEIKKEKEALEKTKPNVFEREIEKPKTLIDELKKEQVKQEVERVRKETKKQKKKANFLTTLLLFITMVLEMCYLGYNIIYMANEKNQLYLIINSVLLLLVTGSFGLGVYMKKEKGNRLMNTLTALLFGCFIGFHLLTSLNIIKLPTKPVVLDFRNKQVVEAMKWANNHKINLKTKYEYSDEFKQNTVISQDIKPDTPTTKVKSLEVVVSSGPNYDLEVNIPDMVGWDVDEVVKLIKKNKLKNVVIDYEFHDEVKRDTAFEQNKNGKMKRNDELKLKFSLGKEEDLKPVDLKDLTNMEEFDATLWLKRNGVKFEIIREYHEDIKKGNVIRTDPLHGTNIKQSETTVKLYISKGKKIKAPDFTKMSLEEIESWANKNNMKISYGSEYHTEIKIGNVIRASVKAGDGVDEETEIYIITSKGPLKMISYSDHDMDKIRSFASEYGLQLVVNEEFSDSVEKGAIISVDKKAGQTLSQSETITVVISRGKKKSIPNFVGMTIGNAKKACNEYGLSCSFNYAYSNKTKDTVINQNKNAGSEVSEGTSVILTVSNGTRPSGGGGSNSSGGNGNNNSGGGNSTPTPTTPTCDKSRGSGLNIQAGSSGSQTQSIIKQLNPNHKFGWNFVNACPNGDSTPGTVCTTGLDGVWKNYCDSVYITIVR